MKATKILAGMSAAAFAASMLTMISSAATEDAFSINFHTQAVGWANYDADTTTIDGNGKYSATISGISATGLTNLGHFDVVEGQTFNLDVTSITVNGEYEVSTEGASGFALANASDQQGMPNIWNDFGKADIVCGDDTASFRGSSSDKEGIKFYVGEDETAVTSLTYNFTVSGLSYDNPDQVVSSEDSSSEADPAPEYQLPQTVDTSSEEYSDWGSQGSVSYEYFKNITPDTDMEVTVNYSINGADTYHILSPRDMNGWTKITQYIKGLGIKEDYTDEELENYTGAPLLQSDGSILVYNTEETSFTFTIDAEGVKGIIDNALSNPDGAWGGLMFQAYDVSVSSVTVAEAGEVVDENCKCGCDCTPDTCDAWDTENGTCGCGCSDVAEFEASLMYADKDWFPNTMGEDYVDVADSKTTAHIAGDGQYTLTYSDPEAAFEGATVLCLDVADVYEQGKDGAKLYEDFDITIDSITVNGNEIIDDVEAYNAFYDQYKDTAEGEAKLEGHIENENTTNYRFDIYNEYGSSKALSTADGSQIIDTSKLVGDTLVITFTVSGLGDMSGNCTCDVCNKPVDNSSEVTSSEENSSGAETPVDSSSAATNSTTTSTTSTTTTTKTDSNPSTGAAALGTVGVLLAGAAMAVSKKKN